MHCPEYLPTCQQVIVQGHPKRQALCILSLSYPVTFLFHVNSKLFDVNSHWHWQCTLSGHPPPPLRIVQTSVMSSARSMIITILFSSLFSKLAKTKLFFNHQCTTQTTRHSPKVLFLRDQLTTCHSVCMYSWSSFLPLMLLHMNWMTIVLPFPSHAIS